MKRHGSESAPLLGVVLGVARGAPALLGLVQAATCPRGEGLRVVKWTTTSQGQDGGNVAT